MKHGRRGISLIEMMVVISITSVMVSAGGICLHCLYQAEQGVRETSVANAAVDRLALQWRVDAHTANAARLGDDKSESEQKLEFRLPDGRTVEYRQQTGQIVRTVRQADAMLHTDAYRIGSRQIATWYVDAGQPQIVAVELTAKPPAETETRYESRQRIEAVVGLHANPSAGGGE